jgi:hypothetical protein
MWDLFRAELLRFRSWAIAYAAVLFLVLAFMTRMFDLAQQPAFVYKVFAAVFALSGLLLGLYQMGAYRRANTWLNLLHRPLHYWQIAAALFGAGSLLLLTVILLPLFFFAGWQEWMTTRVLDTRHLLLIFSTGLIALCGYLAGAYAMLGNKRYGYCSLVFLALLIASNAIGIGAIALQLLVLVWLSVMIAFAFKPDLSAAPRNAVGILATAAPLQITLWLGFLLAGFGVETLSIMQGSHPNNLPTIPPGSAKEADNAEGKDLMIAALKYSKDSEAPLWREQAAISEIFTLGANIPEIPMRNELMNIAPMEFDDQTRRIRWVFSHDSMRFEGYNLATFSSAGTLGVDDDGKFINPPLPVSNGILLSRNTVYQYDSDAKLVLPRAQLPANEIITGYGIIGEKIALLSSHAIYFYDGRELQNGDAVLTARQRVPINGHTGNLTRIDLMELLDGYLMAFTYTSGKHNGDGLPYQQVFRVDGRGKTSQITRRLFPLPYPDAWRYQNWLVSPVLFTTQKAATSLFSTYVPSKDVERPAVPRHLWVIAGILMLVSALLAVWRTQALSLPLIERIAWIIACGLIGIPAFLSLVLLYQKRERLDDIPLAHAATA